MPAQQEIVDRLYVDSETELLYRAFIPAKSSVILLFLHGAAQHSGQFLDLARYCVRNDITFYALDLRGFGESTGHRGHVSSFHKYFGDLDKFISLVGKMHPTEPIFLLGHSLGGMIVTRYVEECNNDLVKGVILSAPALGLRLRIPRLMRWLCHSLSIISPTTYIKPGDYYNARQRNYKDKMSYITNDHTTQFSARWISELFINSHRALRRAKSFRLPALCLCGADDPIVDPEAIKEFYDSLGVSDKQCVVFPAKHNILQNCYNDSIFDQIAVWVKGHMSKDGV